MDAPKKKTGLGTAAFFEQPASEAEPSRSPDATAPRTAPEPVPSTAKSDKMRTTVMLSPDTLAAMDMYKVRLKLQRKKPSYSEIIDEALRLYFRVNEGGSQT